MDNSRIPWVDLISYAEKLGLDENLHDLFVDVIRGLEDEFALWNKKKQKKASKK